MPSRMRGMSFVSPRLRTFIAWFDSEAVPEPKSDGVAWLRILPFIGLHLACLAVFWVGYSHTALIALAVTYALRMFAITGFYHRYFSHKTFKTHRWVESLFGFIGAASAQRGPLWWAATHRHHHKHSDHEEDVHSPVVSGFLWSHIGWLTSMKNFPTNYKAIPDLSRYPELVFLNRYDQTVPLVYGVLMLAIGWALETFVPASGVTVGQFFIWTFFVSTTVLLHGTLFINSLAHVWGRRRYETDDDSRNSWLLTLITLGEGWHNNHHRYPHSVRQGFRWWELDLTYYTLKMLSWTGLIWDLRPVPKAVLEDRPVAGSAPQQSV